MTTQETGHRQEPVKTDVLIIGGGIAGASVGYWLAPHLKTVMLERESQPGYHSTGRSAALFSETYGTRQVCALTKASRAFLETPPAGFTEHPILTPRGMLVVASAEQEHLLEEHQEAARSIGLSGERLDFEGAKAWIPVLRPESTVGAVYNSMAEDIDVHALHQGYLRGFKRAGGTVVNNAEVTAAERIGADWRITASGKDYIAPIVINAAGAWGDEVGALLGAKRVGLEPRRRTAFVFAPPAGLDVTRWPMFISADESCYIKPDAGMLLGSPANADPMPPQDVQPEMEDIALGIHRIEELTTLPVGRPSRVWAGLRSFVSDGDLVGGFDPSVPSLFWLVAQGGYGIQTSAAMGEACAALVRGQPLPGRIVDFGLDTGMLGPARLDRQ
ncbi:MULTISPECIES: NAD(P)/FAD-dependent oxidoreductase [Phyllobacteriaceae]|jgi:D-arginine dehydrogenase|uniref:FAD-dependent oxidoreductase n=2 Tax=Pseudomonadota TaxID=1224 RepID=A0A1C2DE29_9HYPH|nr:MULTISPECIES: FAD-dependent oxidoreductase [Mesorhizobium]MBN9232902.1 FAD-binding oxidoreductase [Mesorhizobium sp.]MDQ0330505.1 D-arginine dehydrogenase [Mesorhizobium sp. YL-MeA3-2017]OCX13024.1 FAD-dependent oxidoreductase [Mesorhizobium hungaricum]